MDKKDSESPSTNMKVPAISGGDASANNLQDISNLIEGVLQQTQERFQTMSDHIIRRIDEMSKRVDDLEKNISDLMSEAGVQTDP